ncbi:MAG: RES domain-containing protein [Mesorhizobium sp.]|nr:RES domain-containing protein [Mesorhizobium sp.]
MRFQGDCYRAHDPRWSFSPLSGDGAAIHGGRFNPKGMPALYLSLSIDGAVAEAAQGFAGKLEPLTVCLYEVDSETILDLTDEAERARAGAELADMACAWALDRAEGREPASWKLARRLVAQGVNGIIAPSFARHARADIKNLVLWRWGRDLPCRVAAHDPSGRLPRDQLSWRD